MPSANPHAEMMKVWREHALFHKRMFWFRRAWVREGYRVRENAADCRRHRKHAWWALKMAKFARAKATQYAERIAA